LFWGCKGKSLFYSTKNFYKLFQNYFPDTKIVKSDFLRGIANIQHLSVSSKMIANFIKFFLSFSSMNYAFFKRVAKISVIHSSPNIFTTFSYFFSAKSSLFLLSGAQR